LMFFVFVDAGCFEAGEKPATDIRDGP
jgi:hypothetical protein